MSATILQCTQCKKITVEPAVADSVLILYPEFHRAYVNSSPVAIEEGICFSCAVAAPRKVTHDLAQK
jgi:hypothetical protein